MERPVAATIVGIVDAAFGIFGICGGVGSILTTVAVLTLSTQSLGIPDNSPFASMAMLQGGVGSPLSLAMLAVNLIFSILLLFSGVGLLMTRPWGRTLALVTAVLALGYFVVIDVMVTILNSGNMAAMMSEQVQMQTPIPPALLNAIMAVSILMAAVFHVFYPVMKLFFLTRPNVKQAFSVGQ